MTAHPARIEAEHVEPIVEHDVIANTYAVTMPSGAEFFISEMCDGDWQISGTGYYSDGHLSPDKAVKALERMER